MNQYLKKGYRLFTALLHKAQMPRQSNLHLSNHTLKESWLCSKDVYISGNRTYILTSNVLSNVISAYAWKDMMLIQTLICIKMLVKKESRKHKNDQKDPCSQLKSPKEKRINKRQCNKATNCNLTSTMTTITQWMLSQNNSRPSIPFASTMI